MTIIQSWQKQAIANYGAKNNCSVLAVDKVTVKNNRGMFSRMIIHPNGSRTLTSGYTRNNPTTRNLVVDSYELPVDDLLAVIPVDSTIRVVIDDARTQLDKARAIISTLYTHEAAAWVAHNQRQPAFTTVAITEQLVIGVPPLEPNSPTPQPESSDEDEPDSEPELDAQPVEEPAPEAAPRSPRRRGRPLKVHPSQLDPQSPLAPEPLEPASALEPEPVAE